MDHYTIFDFETSGLDPETDRVIEMAAIHIWNGRVIGEFSTLVNNAPISDKISEITGITNEELIVAGMPEKTAFQILNKFLANSILIAHNAAFDLSFLHYGLQRHAGRSFDNQFYDTLSISRDRHYYPHKLTDMCDRYGIKLDGAHRALNDVHACWDLFKKMDEEESVSEWINKLGYLSKYDPPKWAPSYAEVFPTENKYEPRSG